MWFADDFVAPLFLNSRIERLHETDLPKASIKYGYVYCRMKADDFYLPLPPLPAGVRVMPPTITAGGFDWVDGSVEVRFENTNAISPFDYEDWPLRNLQVGASTTVQMESRGMLIKFHYFGDK